MTHKTMESKEKFFDRESSALEFNSRVLAEGMDPTNPLMERLKFVGIVSSNLDEFYMVRIASLKGMAAGLDPVREKASELTGKMNTYILTILVPELAEAGLVRIQPESCNTFQLDYLSTFFHKEVLPVLTPIALSQD